MFGTWRAWAVKTTREAHELDARYTGNAWECVSYPMKPIPFQRYRSEKDNSDGGGSNKIGATLVVRGWSDEDVSGNVV